MEGLVVFVLIMGAIGFVSWLAGRAMIVEENRKMAQRKNKLEMEMEAAERNPEVWKYLMEKDEAKEKAQKEMHEKVWNGVKQGGSVAANLGGKVIGRILKK